MRTVAFSFLAFGLAACGGQTSSAGSVALPLESPDGAHALVADFVDICSLYLEDRSASVTLAKARGWESDVTGIDLAAQLTGASMFSHEAFDASLQFLPASYPHLDAKMCMIFVPSAEYVEGDINLDVIHQIDGLQGGYMPVPSGKGNGIGRWSFVAEGGQIVLVNAMRPTDRFIQLNMSTHTEKDPNLSE